MFRVRKVHHQKGEQKHPLVAALQITEQIFRLPAIGGKVGGNDVHVIAGADRLFLFGNLHGVQVGDFTLDGLDGLAVVDTADMEVHHQTIRCLHEIRKHTVIELRRQDLQKGHRPQLFPHTEHPVVSKTE